MGVWHFVCAASGFFLGKCRLGEPAPVSEEHVGCGAEEMGDQAKVGWGLELACGLSWDYRAGSLKVRPDCMGQGQRAESVIQYANSGLVAVVLRDFRTGVGGPMWVLPFSPQGCRRVTF